MRKVFSLILLLAILIPSVVNANADHRTAPNRYPRTPTFVKHIGEDIVHTVYGWPLAAILAGGVLAAEAAPYDHYVRDYFSEHSWLSKTGDNITGKIGAPYVIDTAAAATWAIGAIVKNETIALTGETLTEAVLITEAATCGLKVIAGRTRPNGGTYSFPSGHASRTFAVAAALETLHGPAVGVPAFLFASFIAFSRLDKHVHNLSDVIFGAALGSAIGWGTAMYHTELKERKFVIVPVAGEYTGLQIVSAF